MDPRYMIRDTTNLLSPSLVIYRSLVVANLKKMVEIAGSTDRLRPHIKTHKMPALVKLTESMGIHKHKCATIAEADMAADAGAIDVLIAFPIVGPNVARVAKLIQIYPATTFRLMVDHPEVARALSRGLGAVGRPVPVLVDLEVGMGRTGISPDGGAEALYELVSELPNLEADGLSAYDGHINDHDRESRRPRVLAGLEQTLALRARLEAKGLPVPRLVLGGTPTFPIHAQVQEPGVECSPGTTTLYDDGYAQKYADLPFIPAALLLTRVISQPRPGRLCLDLGHKSVAGDPPVGHRVTLLDIPDVTFVGHSEEHLVIETPQANEYPPGSVVMGIPTHVCPTCALHRWAYVVDDGEVVDRWDIPAGDRVLRV